MIPKVISRTALLLGCLLSANSVLAQGTGSNTNFLAPVDISTFSTSYLDSSSNFRFGQTDFGKFKYENKNLNAQLSRRFDMAGRFAVVTLGASYVDLFAQRVNLDIPNPGEPVRFESSGLADPSVSVRVGLLGAPGLQMSDWVDFDPGVQLYGQLGIRVPLGNYDSSQLINIGYNRYAFDLSLPSVIPLDGARRTTFLEVTPKAIYFTDNDDPFGGSGVVTQDPLYALEVHASHRLSASFWLSLGVQYQNGGGTLRNGVPISADIDQWFGEAGLGMVVSRNIALAVAYGKIMSADNNAEGDAWRLRLSVLL